jgi:hypothetical protein
MSADSVFPRGRTNTVQRGGCLARMLAPCWSLLGFALQHIRKASEIASGMHAENRYWYNVCSHLQFLCPQITLPLKVTLFWFAAPWGPLEFHRCRALLACYLFLAWLTRERSWLRHYASSRKFAGSSPDEAIVLFNWRNPPSRTMALGATQTLTEMSKRNLSWGGEGGKVRPMHKADNFTAICEPIV